jgi:hypothetical protein
MQSDKCVAQIAGLSLAPPPRAPMSDPTQLQPHRRSLSRWARGTLAGIGLYLIVAYLLMPNVGRVKARRHPDLRDGAHLTHLGNGAPGDPLNISLVGTEQDVVRAMLAAGWVPATALGLRNDVRIAIDTVIDKPDPNAPVSNLYLYGRKEDLAFEKPIGHSPRERHHVRFWRSTEVDNNLPVWMGAVTHDIRVEISRTTFQVTHRIDADLDTERAFLLTDLSEAKQVTDVRWINDFHKELQGRNGGGDPWHTDGRLPVVTLVHPTIVP